MSTQKFDKNEELSETMKKNMSNQTKLRRLKTARRKLGGETFPSKLLKMNFFS